jgi:hypothetical protein
MSAERASFPAPTGLTALAREARSLRVRISEDPDEQQGEQDDQEDGP